MMSQGDSMVNDANNNVGEHINYSKQAKFSCGQHNEHEALDAPSTQCILWFMQIHA